MIYKNNKFDQKDYVEEKKEGIRKAVKNLDKRYKNKEIERENFLDILKIFSKRQKLLLRKTKKNR